MFTVAVKNPGNSYQYETPSYDVAMQLVYALQQFPMEVVMIEVYHEDEVWEGEDCVYRIIHDYKWESPEWVG